jgi:hypothetical protein
VLADEDVVEHARTDPRPRSRRLVAPMATLAGTALALGYLAAVDPNQPGHYPLCPTRAIFGVDCPGCGLMRSTHDLVTGNVAGALDHNVLVVVLVPVAIVLWIRWFLQSWRGQSPEVTYGQPCGHPRLRGDPQLRSLPRIWDRLSAITQPDRAFRPSLVLAA